MIRNDSQASLCDDHGNRMQGYNPYSVTVEIGSGAPEATPPRTPGSGRAFHHNNAANEANSAAWGYTKCAMLFFISLIVTWISRTSLSTQSRLSLLNIYNAGTLNGQPRLQSRAPRSGQLPSKLRLCPRPPSARILECGRVHHHLVTRKQSSIPITSRSPTFTSCGSKLLNWYDEEYSAWSRH